jgi:hypothetical protein
MSLVIPPGTGSAALVFTGALGTPEHVTTIGVDLTGVGGDFVTAANSVMKAYATALLPETYSSLTLDHVTLSVGQDGPGGSVDSDLAPFPGTRTGSGVPVAMAPVVRKVTNSIGRRGRGRMFPPGLLNTTEVDANGNISTGRLASLQTAFNLFLTELEAGSGAPVDVPTPPLLLHSPGPVGTNNPTPITALVVGKTVGWIRGRIR